jgi:catechol 2,3-dioxygenase-like lactoylglutathione lyase family enzyme
MFNYTGAFSGFSTDDLQKAKEFYGDLLGLIVSSRNGLLELQPTKAYKVLIYPKPNHIAATYTVLNFMVPNIEKAVEELAALGVQFEQYGGQIQTDPKGISRSPMVDIAWFKDPAGNILAVIEEKKQ